MLSRVPLYDNHLFAKYHNLVSYDRCRWFCYLTVCSGNTTMSAYTMPCMMRTCISYRCIVCSTSRTAISYTIITHSINCNSYLTCISSATIYTITLPSIVSLCIWYSLSVSSTGKTRIS